MKSKRLLLLLLLAIGLPWAANAQTVTIGTGTDTQYESPMDNYYNYSFVEMIYTADEIAAGNPTENTILSVGFHLASQGLNGKTYTITVYMKNIDATSFESASHVAFASTDAVTTKNVTATASGWVTVELDTPFTYDPTKSLLIGVNKTAGGYAGSSYKWSYTTTTEYRHLRNHQDTPAAYDPTTPPTYPTMDYKRPNVQLTFGVPPTCFAPQNLTCMEHTATSATLTWQRHASGTENAWVLQYSTDNTFVSGVQSVNVSNTPSKELTGLTAETKYYARVRPDCDENLWSNVCEFKPTAVVTTCEDFEGVTGTSYSTEGSMPEGWFSYTTATGSYIVAPHVCSGSSYNYYNSGSQSLVFESGTNANSNNAYAVMPANTSGEYSSLTFYTRHENTSYGTLQVGYVTAQTEAACGDFVSLTSITPSTTLHQETIDITSVPSDAFIAFKWQVTNNTYYACGIDDVCIGILPSSTPKPTHLTVSDETASSATVSWQAPTTANPTGYEFMYKLASSSTWPSSWTSSNGQTSVDLTGLSANTTYDFRVRAVYGTDYSDPAETSFTTLATCLPPTSVTCTGVTSTTATFTWDAGGTECQYNLVAPGTPEANYGDGPYSRSGTVAQVTFGDGTPSGGDALQPNTEYLFVVRKWCGDTDYSTWETLTVRTDCGVNSTFPWNENFDGYTVASAYTPSTRTLPTCWSAINTTTNSSYAVYPSIYYYSSTNYANTMPNSLRFYSYAYYYYGTTSDDPQPQYAILPEMSGLAGKEVVLYARGYNTSSTFKIGTMSDPEDASTFDLITEQTGLTTAYQKFNYIIPADCTDSYLAIMIDAATSSRTTNGVYIDDITIKDVVYVDAYHIVNTVSDPATEMIWSDFVSHWNNGDHFTNTTFTLMDDITITEMVGTAENPFTGTFDGNNRTITADLTATDNNFTAPFRIIRNATIQNLKVDGTIYDGGFKFCAGFAGDCYGNNIFTNCESAVTIDATTEGDGTHGGFIARNYGGSSTSNVCTTVFNGCAFTGQLLGTSTTQSAGFCGWSEYTSPNFAKTIFNNCLFDPQAVTMSTTNSATFARRRSASYVNFNNCYFMRDFNDGTNNTAQGKQAYTITGVDPVYVAFSGEHTLYNMSGIDAYTEGMIHGYTKLAGEGDDVTLTLDGAAGYEADHGTLVPNGETFTLTMEAYDTKISAVDCPVPYNVAVPNVEARSAQVTWNGGSDSYTVEYREVITALVDVNDTYGFEDNTLQGWTTISNDNDNNAWSVQSGSSYAHEGSYCVRSRYTSSSDGGDANDWLISPQIPLGGTFSFYARRYSTTYTDQFQVYVSTTGNNISDFTAISEVITPNTTYDKYEYDLSSYSGNGYVAIVYTAPNNQYYVYVDDITITNHIDGEYSDWQPVNNAVSPQALESLTPETTYQVKVSGICAGVPTDYSDVVEFTTPASCVAPTGLAVSGITATGASFSWDAEEGATWQYCTFTLPHADPTDTDFSSSTIYNTASWTNAFIPSTQQIFWLRKDCGNGEYSQPVSVEFTMLDACVNLTCTAVTTTTATLSWTDNAYGVNSWQVMLNNDAEHPITVTTNPCTLTDLTAATAYTAKVRAAHGNCVDGYTDWSNEVNFVTECDVIIVDLANTFTEGFEGTTFPPLCWETIPTTYEDYYYETHTADWTRSTSYSHTSAYSGYYGSIYLVMPNIQISSEANAAQLRFSSYNSFASSYDKNSVVLLDGENETELWSPESVSQSWVETTIDLTDYIGQTISLAFKYEGDDAHGWYIDDVEVVAMKTFTKTIEAVGEEGWANGKGGYYFIASPVDEFVTPAAANGFITDNYDLYYFSQTGDSEGNEWINYKPNGAFDLTNGKGYLYASKEGTTLTFTGTPGTNGMVPLDNYDANARFKGWNLIGNPFAEDAYINKPFYTLENSDIYTSNEAGTAIHAMQGVLIIADAEETTVTFNTEAPAANNSKLNMNLRRDNKQLDNAILVFGGEQQLGKISFREGSSKVYMPVEGKDYAITSVEGQVGEVPVSFKAETNGTYSLSFTNEEVTFSYLHLIDNMTGADVDLLANPTYSFDARTTDYESRFRLVFATGSSVDGDSFGFINGMGNLTIFGIEGEATLQVIDVTGRMLSSETFSGSYEKRLNVAPGVYMLRLINGNDVKVQKMVVR